MSRFLYKYMPLRAEFFKDPMIKATSVLNLNDPFEGCFNIGQIRDADRNHREYYKSKGKDVDCFNESTIDCSMEEIQSVLHSLGVLSFSEVCNTL